MKKEQQDRITTFLHEVEQAVESIADGYSDLGIYIEYDSRGLGSKLAVRIRPDKSGGIIGRQKYEPITRGGNQ